MEQEKNKQVSNLEFNMSGLEELFSLIDPNEEVFSESKRLLKELKKNTFENNIDKKIL